MPPAAGWTRRRFRRTGCASRALTCWSKRVDVQIQSVLDDATRASATAAKGSPTQQVGDFYASGMDEKRLTDLGVAPLQAGT